MNSQRIRILGVVLVLSALALFSRCTKTAPTNALSGGTSTEVVGIEGFAAFSGGLMAGGALAALRMIDFSPFPDSASLKPFAHCTTNQSGYFFLPCSLNGEFLVTVSARNGNIGARSCTLSVRRTLRIDTIVCRQPGRVIGRVVCDTAVIPGLGSRLVPDDFFAEIIGDGGFFSHLLGHTDTVFDTTGIFSFDTVPAGTYTLRIRPAFTMYNPYAATRDTQITVGAGQVSDAGDIAPLMRSAYDSMAAYQKDFAAVLSFVNNDTAEALQCSAVEYGRITLLAPYYLYQFRLNANIQNLDQLEYLFVLGSLDTIPNEMGRCRNLLVIQVLDSRIVWVGDSVANLTNLKYCILDNCGLNHVPAPIMRLPAQTIISLSQNSICNPTPDERAWLDERFGPAWADSQSCAAP